MCVYMFAEFTSALSAHVDRKKEGLGGTNSPADEFGHYHGNQVEVRESVSYEGKLQIHEHTQAAPSSMQKWKNVNHQKTEIQVFKTWKG